MVFRSKACAGVASCVTMAATAAKAAIFLMTPHPNKTATEDARAARAVELDALRLREHVDRRRDAIRGQVVAHLDQRADAFGPVNLVCGHAHRMHVERGEIDRNLAERLHGVGMHPRAPRAREFTNRRDVLDHAGRTIVLHHHDAVVARIAAAQQRRRVERMREEFARLTKLNGGKPVWVQK